MEMKVSTDILENINYDPEESEEIAQNIAALMVTPVGSVPLERGMGMRMQHRDMSQRVARMMYEEELREALDEYESRAEVTEVAGEADEEGNMTATVEVIFNG